MYSVELIADSVSSEGIRLSTFQCVYPRMIHAEVMTHRVFSRNASSSRAIPVDRMVETALKEMVYPLYWGKNQRGMQSSLECLEGDDLIEATQVWEDAATTCAKASKRLAELGLHKQWANRPLEWFSNIRVLISATEISNFYDLRDHEDAQPEIHELARVVRAAQAASNPTLLKHGEWHLPYIKEEERNALPIALLKNISAARCCRVSYKTTDGRDTTAEEDLALCDRLVGARPLHASPFEHQATPIEAQLWGGNFRGWKQYRSEIESNI